MKFCQIYTHYSHGKVELIDFHRCTQCTEPDFTPAVTNSIRKSHVRARLYRFQRYISFSPLSFLSLPGVCDSWAVCFCTSRRKYILLSEWHPPCLPAPAHAFYATTTSSVHPTLQRWNTNLLTWLTLAISSGTCRLKWKWRNWDAIITCSLVVRDVTVFSDDCREKGEFVLREMTPSVIFANVRLAVYCSCQLLWNNPVWLVSSNFLPTLQLTKLHQLAMQHIPLPSLGQSNPTFPGTYPWLLGEVHLSPCHHSSLKSHHQNVQECGPSQVFFSKAFRIILCTPIRQKLRNRKDLKTPWQICSVSKQPKKLVSERFIKQSTILTKEIGQ